MLDDWLCLPWTDTVTEHVSCFFVRSVFTMEATAANRCLRLYFKRSWVLIHRASVRHGWVLILTPLVIDEHLRFVCLDQKAFFTVD